MIKFKKNYYQMKTNGNKLSIRFANYRVSPDYLYDAFKDKDGDNDYMYIAAYPGSKRLDGNILSASSDIPLNETMSYYRDNKTDYELMAYDKYKYLYGLLVLITKSMDFNKKIGTAANSTIPNGTMNKKGLFYGNQNPDEGNKVFGIENLWSVNGTIVEGLIKHNNKMYYKAAAGFNDDISNYHLLNTQHLTHGSGFISGISSDKSHSIIYPTTLAGSSSMYTTSYYHSPSLIDDNNYHFTMGSAISQYAHMMNMRSDLSEGNMRLVL